MRATFHDEHGARFPGLHLTRFWQRTRGWLLRTPSPEVMALLLSPCSAVHTWGVARPLDILFLTSGGEVLRHERNVRPGALPAWQPGAWGVLEVDSRYCPQHWQPRRIAWRYNRH